MLKAGTTVKITTRNGGALTGTLVLPASLDYGSQYPVVRTADGRTVNYRYAIVTYPNGQEVHGIPGPVTMEPIL